VSSVRYELGFHISEDDILHTHRRGNLRPYTRYFQNDVIKISYGASIQPHKGQFSPILVKPFSNCTRTQSPLAYISLNPLFSPSPLSLSLSLSLYLQGRPNNRPRGGHKILQNYVPHTCLQMDGPDLISHRLEDLTKSNVSPLSIF
jgi:hypothetical protein